MAQTLAEKIISGHTARKVAAGELAVAEVDLAYAQDGTGPLTVRQLEKMGLDRLAHPDRTLLFLDHAAPSPRSELSNDHNLLRAFARRTGAVLSDVGEGISHQIVLERYAAPGMLIVGADSHTCTGGALAAFATGMGSTDIAAAFGLGKTWLRVPASFLIRLVGKLPKGVFAKDAALSLIGRIGSEGANYMALEFTGDALPTLDMSGRIPLSNMAVECGAKAGLFPADAVTQAYLKKVGRARDFRKLAADKGARYEQELEIDLPKLGPMVSRPHLVDNAVPVDQVLGVHVDQVFLGTCTNGQAEDFRVAAAILKGRRVAEGTRLLCAAPSRKVLLDIIADGTYETLLGAGGVFVAPGCGACVGVHCGVLGDAEVCLSTQNRNFQGRMGNPKASVYLASPATAAATAAKGAIADPREFL
jgi:3-isopropylmalate/(R)-2-methylmalate dehydratase large subunit